MASIDSNGKQFNSSYASLASVVSDGSDGSDVYAVSVMSTK